MGSNEKEKATSLGVTKNRQRKYVVRISLKPH